MAETMLIEATEAPAHVKRSKIGVLISETLELVRTLQAGKGVRLKLSEDELADVKNLNGVRGAINRYSKTLKFANDLQVFKHGEDSVYIVRAEKATDAVIPATHTASAPRRKAAKRKR